MDTKIIFKGIPEVEVDMDVFYHEWAHWLHFLRPELSRLWAERCPIWYAGSGPLSWLDDSVLASGALTHYSGFSHTLGHETLEGDNELKGELADVMLDDVIIEYDLCEVDVEKAITSIRNNKGRMPNGLGDIVDHVQVFGGLGKEALFDSSNLDEDYLLVTEDIANSAEAFSLAARFPSEHSRTFTFLHYFPGTRERLRLCVENGFISKDVCDYLVDPKVLKKAYVGEGVLTEEEKDRKSFIDSVGGRILDLDCKLRDLHSKWSNGYISDRLLDKYVNEALV